MIYLINPKINQISGGLKISTIFSQELSNSLNPTNYNKGHRDIVIWRLNKKSKKRIFGLLRIEVNSSFYGKIYAIASYLPNLLRAALEIIQESKTKDRNEFNIVILTHYSTFPIAILINLFGNDILSIVFIQGLEWKFMRSSIIQKVVKSLMVFACSKADIIVYANTFLREYIESKLLPKETTKKLSNNPSKKSFVYPIWIDKLPEIQPKDFNIHRDTDILFCLRNGYVKAPDLYYEFFVTTKDLRKPYNASAFAPNRLAVRQFESLNIDLHYELNRDSIDQLYKKSKIFLCMSRSEGFGLTVLESMSYGVVPVVIDNGGCWNYLKELPELVLDTNSTHLEIMRKIDSLIEDQAYWQTLSNKVIEIAKSGYEESNQLRYAMIRRLSNFVSTRK